MSELGKKSWAVTGATCTEEGDRWWSVIENSPYTERSGLGWRSLPTSSKEMQNWVIIAWGEAAGEDTREGDHAVSIYNKIDNILNLSYSALSTI